jgi:hypothetical protein
MTSERLNNHYSIFTIKSSPNCQFSKLMLFVYCPDNYKNNINFIHVNRILSSDHRHPRQRSPWLRSPGTPLRLSCLPPPPSSALGTSAAQSAAAKCAIWSACAFTKDGRPVARVT